MKLLKHLTFILFFASIAQAADYDLKEVCAKDPAKRAEFAEKTREQIIKRTLDMKEDSKAARKFDGSDMQQWLKFTYPAYMPKFLYDAGDKECANMHLDYLEATDKTAKDKALADWKTCLQAAYRTELRPMMTRLFECYSADAAPSK